jgi:hypothetical protein
MSIPEKKCKELIKRLTSFCTFSLPSPAHGLALKPRTSSCNLWTERTQDRGVACSCTEFRDTQIAEAFIISPVDYLVIPGLHCFLQGMTCHFGTIIAYLPCQYRWGCPASRANHNWMFTS